MRNVLSRRAVISSVVGLAALVGAPNWLGAADEPTSCCPDITGCWDCGSWRSFCTSHHGKLRAKITRCDASHYKCTFSGTFFGVVPFRYTATLTVTGYGDGVVYFRSSRNLPLFGGTFSMCGQASSCSFTANYTSPKDRGVFNLTR